MVTHIVLWNIESKFHQNEREAIGQKIKTLLEPIKDLVPGAVNINVVAGGLTSSNREVALISSFETVEALEAYQIHPAHIEAGKYIKSVTCDRACMDFVE